MMTTYQLNALINLAIMILKFHRVTYEVVFDDYFSQATLLSQIGNFRLGYVS